MIVPAAAAAVQVNYDGGEQGGGLTAVLGGRGDYRVRKHGRGGGDKDDDDERSYKHGQRHERMDEGE